MAHTAQPLSDLPKIILRVDTSRACGRGILLGVAAYCRAHEQWQLSQQPPFYVRSVANEASWSESWEAQGIIISRPDIPQNVIDMGIPIIGVDVRRPIANLPNIVGDAEMIARMAAEHFLQRGFQHFAYCGFQGIPWAVQRGDCFVTQISAAGFSIESYYQPEPPDQASWDQQPLHLADWIERLPKPMGLFVCNDDGARLVLQACRIGGVQVPEAVAVLGVDNDGMICSLCDPPLSSIALSFQQVGYEAAALLDQMMQGQERPQSQRILLEPSHVYTRQSTDILAVSDSTVAQAIRFIREHAGDPIQVNDVVEAVATSRRALEYRFEKALGFSINHNIKHVRTEQITLMLTETDLTVSQIANLLGYTDTQHIARYFRREKGMSPQAFRRTCGRS